MPISTGHALEINQLSMRYPGSHHWILNGLDLAIPYGYRLALVGPSGAGKSSVAKVALQMLPNGSQCFGKILVSGKDPRYLTQSQLRTLRGKSVGLIFQDPMNRLNPLMTIGRHLVDMLRHHLPFRDSFWYHNRAKELMERVGISNSRFNAYPHELSGGMRQRVVIALAIALNPPLIIADEPTTSLDVAVANQILSELKEITYELGSSLLLITHDLALAANWCEAIAVLDKGRIVEEEKINDLLLNPKELITKKMVSAARSRESFSYFSNIKRDLYLEVVGLRCWHPLKLNPWQIKWIKAVNEISFELYSGETLGIVGVSGCGKSTLCRALIGLTPTRGGQVKLLGKSMFNSKGNLFPQVRKDIQMVFQDPLACLNPKMSICEAIADPLLIHNLTSISSAHKRACELLELVGLTPVKDFLNRKPKELSGGQQQRVAIARAIILEPKILICDESVSMLDPETQASILSLLNSLKRKLRLAILFVTHDLSIAKGFCNRVIVLEEGSIIEEGPGEILFSEPSSDTTRTLVASCPRLP